MDNAANTTGRAGPANGQCSETNHRASNNPAASAWRPDVDAARQYRSCLLETGAAPRSPTPHAGRLLVATCGSGDRRRTWAPCSAAGPPTGGRSRVFSDRRLGLSASHTRCLPSIRLPSTLHAKYPRHPRHPRHPRPCPCPPPRRPRLRPLGRPGRSRWVHLSPADRRSRMATLRLSPDDLRWRATTSMWGGHLPRWRNWQTHYLEVVAPARAWRFKSSPRHFLDPHRCRACGPPRRAWGGGGSGVGAGCDVPSRVRVARRHRRPRLARRPLVGPFWWLRSEARLRGRGDRCLAGWQAGGPVGCGWKRGRVRGWGWGGHP